ncbi:MAG: YceI family protein [Chitinophagales bacterium]|nr:YceI family protein [Chitinophagaceae bacterium]MBP9884258.1 YceI family protein [Chitinophagales bacterium]
MATVKWTLDKAHSQLQFKVRHMMLTTVTGDFKEFDIEVETAGDDFSTAKINVTANIESVASGSEQRDTHLKSDDFFNAEKFPALSFTGTSLTHAGDDHWILQGDLTIRDITKPVSFQVLYMGMIDDPWGNKKAGFEVNGKVSRKEYGLLWNVVTEAGGVVASDDVRIHCNVQFIKQS